MLDVDTAQQAYFQQLSSRWGESGNFVELPSSAALKRTKRPGTVGWRTHLPTDYLGKDRTVDFVLSDGFPIDPPQLWVEPNPFLEWPHAESDGKLCLWPPGQAPVWSTPAKFATATLDRLQWLFAFVQSGADESARDAEFASEWLSYWWLPKRPLVRASGSLLLLDAPLQHAKRLDARILSLPAPTAPDDKRHSRSLIVASAQPDLLLRWISHSGLACESKELTSVLVIPLASAPIKPGAPDSMPVLRSFVQDWAQDPEAAMMALKAILDEPSDMGRWVVLTHGESACAALRLVPRKAPSKARGRQNRKSRKHDDANRKRIGFAIVVANVQRADPNWMQERAMNKLMQPLKSAHVVVVGCGSLGSMATESLALAGIGKLTLIDPGILETANVGRHALGMGSVDQHKVFALQTRLLSDYPHLEIDAIDHAIQSETNAICGALASADLVLCATADPGCEAYLMNKLRESAFSSLMLAWSEPHAMAGHSLHSPGAPYSPESLFQGGRCIGAATQWPEDQSTPLPGCGESHISGAGNRIRLIASTVAEHAVDTLLGAGSGEHRVWVASSRSIEAVGGSRSLPTGSGTATTIVTTVPRASQGQENSIAV